MRPPRFFPNSRNSFATRDLRYAYRTICSQRNMPSRPRQCHSWSPCPASADAASVRKNWARAVILMISLVALVTPNSQARGDWPQILGPNRDGQAITTSPLAVDWPAQLEPLWSFDLGSGYGGAAIRGAESSSCIALATKNNCCV